MRNFLLACILLIGTGKFLAQGPAYLWAKSGTGSSNDYGQSTVSDSQGNVYLTGAFQSTVLVCGTATLSNNGDFDVFLTKYDASGNVIWCKGAGGSGMDYAYSIAADPNGNVYITGWFTSSTIAFGTSTLTNAGVGAAIFLVKYDPAGNVLWAQTAPGSTAQNAYGVATDNNGNVYIAGEFQSPTIAFGTTTLTNAGGIVPYDCFIAKCDQNGNFLWAAGAGGTGIEIANSLAVDNAGNAYITGNFNSATLTFSNTTLINAGGGDIFLTKYNANGTVAWATSAGGVADDAGNAVTIDNLGNIGLAGMYTSPVISFGTYTLSNAGNNDIFIASYSSSGTALWANSFGGNQSDEVFNMCTDSNGNFYIAGAFQSSSLSIGSTTLNNAGNYDIVVAKFDPSGLPMWAISEGGSGYDYGYSLCNNGSPNLYISGYFSSSSIAFGTNTLTSTGMSDFFIAKLGVVIVGVNEQQTAIENYNIYPNPFSDFLKIEISQKDSSPIRIELSDVTGKVIKSFEKNELIPENNSLEIHLLNEEQPDGIYFVKIISSDGVWIKKLSRFGM
ncbi:MAG: SBBP repeat-containing protein [Bacteroidia bacterium]